MARISLDPPRTPLYRLASWYARRRYGRNIQPLQAAGHHSGVLGVSAGFELSVGRWKALDPALKHFAEMAAAVRIGCSWCVDFGYWQSVREGTAAEKMRYVPVWREHRDRFTELEVRVIEYAEAMTETEPTVTDEMTDRLIAELGEKAFVELTAMVALENMRSRTNAALGLVGQGFSDQCAVPPLPRSTR